MNINKFVAEIKKQEADMLEGLVNSPSTTLEAHHYVIGRIQGLRDALDTLMQQMSDE
jgi:hypothetical protein